MTSLDDLLDRDAARPDDRPVRSPAARRLRSALAVTLVAAALGAALVVVGLGFSLWYPLAMAAVLAGLLLHRVVAGLPVAPARHRPRAGQPVDSSRPDPQPSDPAGLVPAVDRWQARLLPDRPGRPDRPGHPALRPSLAELVDERLRQRHGCTRASDPDRAWALLGERLWRYLADPAARTPQPRELAALLTTVEAL